MARRTRDHKADDGRAKVPPPPQFCPIQYPAPTGRFPRPCVPARDRSFTAVWQDARRRLDRYDQLFPTLHRRLAAEPGFGGVDLDVFSQAWHWEWMFNVFYNCRAGSVADLRAIVAAAQEFEGRAASCTSLARVHLVAFRNPLPLGEAFRGRGHVVSASMPSEDLHLLPDEAAFGWADRLLNSAPLTDDERTQLLRLDYIADHGTGRRETWAGASFRNYRRHVVRAIRDFIRRESLRRNLELPAGLDEMGFDLLLDTTTNWLPRSGAGAQTKAKNRGGRKRETFGKKIFPWITKLRKPDRNGKQMKWETVAHRIKAKFDRDYDPNDLSSMYHREKKKRAEKRANRRAES